MEWTQIRSWHIIKFTSRGGQHKTLCGRWSTSDAKSDFPHDGKTCESCLRNDRKRKGIG